MLSFKYVDRKLVVLAIIALAIELWMFFSDFHFLWRPLGIRQNTIRVAQVESVTQLAKARTRFQLNWYKIEAGNDLFEGDEIMTGPSSALSLRFLDGRSVSVGANSMIVLKKTRLLNSRAFILTLVQGSVQQDVSAGLRGSGQIEIEVGSQKVVSSGAASFKIENTGSGQAKINVNQGKVQVTDAGVKPVQVENTNSGNRNYFHELVRMKAALLSKPDNEAIIEFLGNSKPPVILEWKSRDHEGGRNIIEVAKDREFKDILMRKVVEASVPNSTVTFNPPKGGIYYWHVTRTLGTQNLVSSTASFMIQHRLEVPLLMRPKIVRSSGGHHPKIDAPVLKRPVIHYIKEGAFEESLFERVVTFVDRIFVSSAFASEKAESPKYSVDLEWQQVPGATSYMIQIATDSEFKHVGAEKILEGSKYTWNSETAGYYYWRVAAFDSDGARSPYSEFMTFVIQAERNNLEDETSYETYLMFDEYSKHQNTLRLFYGPELSEYYFTSPDPNSPSGVSLKTSTFINAQLQYSYWLNPYYSLKFMLNANKTFINPGDFESAPADQGVLVNHETQFRLGIERRFFRPTYYFTLRAGIEVSYLNRPVNAQDGSDRLALSSFGYFGPYVLGGIHKRFFDHYLAGMSVGGLYESTGDSYRFGQLAIVEVQRPITETLSVGLWVQEEWSDSRVNAAILKGAGHSLIFWPMAFLEVTF